MVILRNLKLKDYATMLGTLCGLLAIVLAISFKAYRAAVLFIFLGIIADLLDGYLARKMNQMNELGKELDSLSDGIVFGVAPALVAFATYSDPNTSTGLSGITPWIMIWPTLIFILGAIVRLAWFNISENEGYQGLPTPLSAGFLALTMMLDYFAWVINQETIWLNIFFQYFIPVFMIFLAWLNITSFVAYGKNIRKKSGKLKYVFIGLGTIIIIIAIFGTINRYAASIYIFCILIILWAVALGFIVLGFINAKHMKCQNLKTAKSEQEN